MPPASHRRWLLAAALLAFAGGCSAGPQWVSVRSSERNALAAGWERIKPQGEEPSERTAQLLRRYDLTAEPEERRDVVLATVAARARDADAERHEHEYAMAEIAFLGAKKAEDGDASRAVELYGAALLHAYRYLFDPSDGMPCNPYDPQFRGACDLYNGSLEGLLRIVQREGPIRPGDRRTLQTTNHTCSFDVQFHSSGWHAEDFDRFEFVSDYEITGLRNHYHTYGLGVPLIAIRKAHDESLPAEQYYPSRLCFPITAFLRIEEPAASASAAGVKAPPRFVLELRDPLDGQDLMVAGHRAPLESDLSTPLAYFLNQPAIPEKAITTLGLLRPDKAAKLQGLYMLEPYDPNKMPVLMVHGLWSSPITWMEMYNDLRSDPQVREHYQFWSYLYPTGQPFWVSGAQLRRHLAEARQTLDPGRKSPALDQMVLVGHSMGGLVSKLQSVDSGRDFWRINSEQPFEQLNADPETYDKLAKAYFFRPNESVRRVVTIGTPHRGSRFSNDFTRWLGSRLIDAPMRLMQGREQLLSQNPDYFKPYSALDIRTSIDSLGPSSPVLPVLLAARPGPWVTYHNVVGRSTEGFLSDISGEEGDGVVSLASANLETMPQVESQLVVPADHLSVHRHPQSVLEVRRILLKQVEELRNLPHGNATGIQLVERAEADRALVR